MADDFHEIPRSLATKRERGPWLLHRRTSDVTGILENFKKYSVIQKTFWTVHERAGCLSSSQTLTFCENQKYLTVESVFAKWRQEWYLKDLGIAKTTTRIAVQYYWCSETSLNMCVSVNPVRDTRVRNRRQLEKSGFQRLINPWKPLFSTWLGRCRTLQGITTIWSLCRKCVVHLSEFYVALNTARQESIGFTNAFLNLLFLRSIPSHLPA